MNDGVLDSVLGWLGLPADLYANEGGALVTAEANCSFEDRPAMVDLPVTR